MRSATVRPSRRRRGQALVETALLFPILMFLVMGADDFGRVFYYAIAVTNAAREGARQAAYYDPVSNTNSSDNAAAIYNAVLADLPAGITPTQVGPGNPADCPSTPYTSANYPAAANSAYVYICFDGSSVNTTAAQGRPVTITILYSFTPVTPMAALVGIGTLHVQASTTMIVQGVS